jgi:prolyl oligopeptidase
VPANDAVIRHWTVTAHHIVLSYLRGTRTYLEVFDASGKRVGRIPSEDSDTVRLVTGEFAGDEVLLERESFLRPVEVVRYSVSTGNNSPWIRRKVPLDPSAYVHTEVRFTSKDGTQIPMFLLGRRVFLEEKDRSVVMTAYGGYGTPRTPQFSVLVTFLIERGCLFALPNIRGGSEFGADWHNAARRQKRQVAFDDFLCAAEWLIRSGRTTPAKLAIFGGSNSGLLVAAAMTQRPDLFRAGLCMVPLTDMLRYHLFDDARVWKDELGTADDVEDFKALSSYSPYHAVRPKTGYPATMIVSGDADQNCNALHARKMTARLQAANISNRTILLDYSQFRGHSPVLPLTHRVNALTDRLAFLSAELELAGQIEDPYAVSVS